MKAMDSKPHQKERKKDIMTVFKKYDRTNKGYINLSDLSEMTKLLK
jgi:Ca2+-binding EF-hand superfamily protein